jgi:hypothetical protein
MDPEPIRMYEPTPKVVASNVVFLAAWLAGTTGYFLVRATPLIDIVVVYSKMPYRAFSPRLLLSASGGSPLGQKAEYPHSQA